MKYKFQQDIFPSNWKNPISKESYDLLIIGGGPGGMTAAMFARTLNVSVALVEKEHLGGECLSYGCIPSKAFLRSSRAASEIRRAKEFGIEIPTGWSVDFAAVMQRVHNLQALISPHDSPENLKALGIDVFLGSGAFVGDHKLQVDNQTITFKKAIIATGTQPVALKIEGLDPSDYLTNQNIFDLTSLPRRLGVIGGGPIGCELSQAFLRLGSQVTLITRAASLIPRDDSLASQLLQEVLKSEGMKVLTHSTIQRVEKRGNEKILYLDNSERIVVDELLVAIGRSPTINGLNLEQVEVSYEHQKGISVNEYLQTTNPDIYAGGDVTSPNKFTHMSKELSTIAVINALQGNQKKSSDLVVPWCTYTSPEVAHVGLNEDQAKAQGIAFESIVVEMKDVDRAVVDGETTGFVKLLVKENSDQIIGATFMAEHAGEQISELTVAINSDKGLMALARSIHPFPTQAEILRIAAQRLLQKRNSQVLV